MKAEVSPSLIDGTVKAPQSKSIAIRLLFASLLGDVKLENLQHSEDVDAAFNAISRIRKAINSSETNIGTVDVKGSGTTLRMLLPVLAFLGKECTIQGDETLQKRPVGVMKSWLESNDISVSSDHIPLTISGKISSHIVEISGSESSQYISGIIYGLLLTGGGMIKLVPPVRSASYIEMTCAVLNSLGCSIQYKELEIDVQPLKATIKFQGEVPGDFLLSSFYAAAALITNGKVEITGLSNPKWSEGDSRIVDVMRSSGADSYLEGDTWHVSGRGDFLPFRENVEDSPDMAVSLAALTSVSKGEYNILGTHLLGIKESDRIKSISMVLKAFGIDVSTEDGLKITNTENWNFGLVKDWKDHRIAMLGTVLALRSGGLINGAESVTKSNPGFYDDLIRLGAKITLRS